MSDDIRLEGDGEIQITDIEASAPEGRKPRIRTKPAYSGGKLDVAWNVNGERLPVVVDLETLEYGSGMSIQLLVPTALLTSSPFPPASLPSIDFGAALVLFRPAERRRKTFYGNFEYRVYR